MTASTAPVGSSEAREREKRTFFELADRLAHAEDAAEQKRLKEELAGMTFGD